MVNDVDALESACKELGFNFKRGQKKYKWYGRWVNDYHAKDAAYKLGIDPKDYGKCEHAISMPGVNYEVGVCKDKNGNHVLVCDDYSDGKKIRKAIEAMKQMYSVHKTTKEAKKKGYRIKRTKEEGKIRLRISGM